MDEGKKPRKANFTDLEVEVLVDAVSTNYKVLYGKFSPSLTNSMKTAAWESVTEKYQMQFFTHDNSFKIKLNVCYISNISLSPKKLKLILIIERHMYVYKYRVNAVSLQCRREVGDIKKKWQDLQSVVKKKESQRRKSIRQTGGGPMELGAFKPWEEKVCL
ncbi:uncharacterized protein LOC134260505 [Saccostrea cucullata]|uniref:uncharacterized protein LOC134260505 n=1 Tax=Saccostrea cuccullata TaxID=36930 RepID=UPI002ED06B0D